MMKYIKALAITVAFISFSACNLTSHNEQLEQDLNNFCQVYAKQNLENIHGIDSISEKESYINDLAKSAVNSQLLIDIIDEIPQIEFYRQVYPETKQKIEILYGKEWSCPEFEAFYTPSISKSLEENRVSIRITLNSNGEFFINEKKLELNENKLDNLKADFTVNGTPVDSAYVVLEEQASEELLQPLLNVLPSLGIENITLETN